MSVSVVSHDDVRSVFCVKESEWTATVSVSYVSRPGGPFVHDEGLSVLCTSDDSFICVNVSVVQCEKREVVRNIDDFCYHKYVCAEAWCVVWGKLYAKL